jgi:ABC-type transporter Mla subunit MlaD
MEGGGATWEETPESAEAEPKEEGEKDKITESFKNIQRGFQDGGKAFTQGFLTPLFSDLENYAKDTQNAALKGPDIIIKALEEMRDTIEGGLARVQSFFETTLDKEIEGVSKSVEDQLRKFDKAQGEIPAKLQAFSSKMGESLTNTIGSQLEKALDGVISNLKKLVISAETIAQKQTEFSKSFTDQEVAIKSFVDSIKSTGTQLSNSVGAIPKTVNGLIGKKTDSMKVAVQDLKKNSADIKAQMDELTKILMSKRKK